MMTKCPVCETEYTENEVETCSVCGYDLTPYPPIDEIPSELWEKEKKRIAVAKRVWKSSQSQVKSAQLMVSHLQSYLYETTRNIYGFTQSQSQLPSQSQAIASQSQLLSRLESQSQAIASQSQLLSRLESQVKAIASQLPSQSQAIASQLPSQSQAIASQLPSQSQAIASQLQSQSQAIASQLQSQSQAITSQLQSQSQAIASQLQSQSQVIASQLQSQSQAIASQSQLLSRLESQVEAIAFQLPSQSQAIASQSQLLSRLESQSQAIASQLPSQSQAIASQLPSQSQAIASQLPSQSQAIASQLDESITEAVADITSIVSSSSGFDYSQLDRLLKSGQWEAADEETTKMMCRVAGKTSRRYLDDDDIKNFPGEDLRIIDGLWVKHSRGRFGFSVQKQIYINCGGLPDGRYPGDTIWERYCGEVGWRVNGSYISWSDCTFSAAAPLGHLPARFVGVGWWLGFGVGLVRRRLALFSRAETCRL
ncbi:GUN4 domain-containing protein [Limnospira fusiformis KN01]|uniref:GUN4 domain-containing protein n=1 Tax=Limnospira fusiformis TaxID=54297 RepID=UPI001658C0F2|nr:GUN4 domain-containing protein [Limnospira fusiformis]ULB47280.1 GUN4 domain-containing protein [Limnospira fusiformis KN01]